MASQQPSSTLALGDLKYEDPVEVLKSDNSGGEKVAQSVRFVVSAAVSDPDAANADGDIIVLCWVDLEGKLQHHYTHTDGVMDHDENTFTGDAFVAYRVLTSDAAASDKPQEASVLADTKSYAVLFSYRLRQALDQDKFVHCVQYSSAAAATGGCQCRVMSVPKGDNEYRVIAGLPPSFGPHRLPPPDEPWEVLYEYVCPPVPSSATWNKTKHTFYLWGDMDFDDYGASHHGNVSDRCKKVHPCRMNQIVPQLMIGNCLASADAATYTPSWTSFDSWVLQAQYYWQDGEGDDRAMCGPVVDAEPGDVIRTKIRYDAEPGSISASIAVLKEDDVDKKEDPRRRSKIVIQRPFPHDPSLFRNWRDFFQRCIDAERGVESVLQRLLGCCGGSSRSHRSLRGSGDGEGGDIKGPLGRPYLNVEYKGRVDLETLKSVCPFVVHEASYPGLTPGSTSKWKAEMYCPRTGRVDTLKDSDESNCLTCKDAISLFQG